MGEYSCVAYIHAIEQSQNDCQKLFHTNWLTCNWLLKLDRKRSIKTGREKDIPEFNDPSQ